MSNFLTLHESYPAGQFFRTWDEFNKHYSDNSDDDYGVVAVHGGISRGRIILPGVLLVGGGINEGFITAEHIVFGGGINKGIIWAKQSFQARGGIFPDVYIGEENVPPQHDSHLLEPGAGAHVMRLEGNLLAKS